MAHALEVARPALGGYVIYPFAGDTYLLAAVTIGTDLRAAGLGRKPAVPASIVGAAIGLSHTRQMAWL